MEKIRNFFKDESGATMVEYALLVALIGIMCIVAITQLQTSLNTTFTTAKGSLDTANGGGS